MVSTNDKARETELLWQLRQALKEHANASINFKRLCDDVDYRVEVIKRARQLEIAEIKSILSEWDLLSGSTAGSLKVVKPVQQQQQRVSPVMEEEDTPVKKSNSLGGFIMATLFVLALGGVAGFLYQAGYLDKLINPNGPDDGSDNGPDNGSVVEEKILPVENAKIVLRIHGSNTVGQALSPALVEGYFKTIKGAREVLNVPGAVPEEKQIQAVLTNMPTPIAVEIHAHGSSTAFKDLDKGLTDMGQSSRRIKQKEIDALRSRYGDLSSQAGEHIIALDGLAVIIHPNNSIDSLTTLEIAKLFSGEITNWTELGGPDLKVSIYARDNNSGTWDTFKNLVLKPNKVKLSETAKRYENSDQLSDEVAADPGAIGFIGLAYVRSSKLLAVADSKDSLPVIPTVFTVATEDYPLSRRLYFYTPTMATGNVINAYINEIVTYTLSQEGQNIVEKIGFVSQNIITVRPRLTATQEKNLPAGYINRIREAERLSVNFRFEAGSLELDNKARQDLQRVVDFLSLPQNRSRNVMLFGFSDSTEEEPEKTSEQRAQKVTQALVARGIFPTDVKGFGATGFVATNETDAGRIKNRRVEVWIK